LVVCVQLVEYRANIITVAFVQVSELSSVRSWREDAVVLGYGYATVNDPLQLIQGARAHSVGRHTKPPAAKLHAEVTVAAEGDRGPLCSGSSALPEPQAVGLVEEEELARLGHRAPGGAMEGAFEAVSEGQEMGCFAAAFGCEELQGVAWAGEGGDPLLYLKHRGGHPLVLREFAEGISS
jgi:hypothetical protein